MKIRYLGHSSFLMTSGAGVAVVTDPYAPEVGFKMPNVSADIVTVSHRHYDHDNVKAVDGNCPYAASTYARLGASTTTRAEKNGAKTEFSNSA